MRKTLRQGFSLVEMLVVLAITAVLLSIIILPMIQSFNFTRAAEGLAEQQQRGRILIDQISRDIASGTAVGDNEGPNGETVIQVPYQNTVYEFAIYNSRLDIYKSARSSLLPQSGGAFYNEQNGHYDPTLHDNNGQPIFPAAQGNTIVRYFIGLREPYTSTTSGGTTTYAAGLYNNPYEDVLQNTSKGGHDNLFVLRRAEVPLYNGTTYNSNYFKQDPKHPGSPYLSDPYFFTLSANDPYKAANGGDAGQATRMQNWINASTIVTADSRFDMIMPIYNFSSGKVYTYPTTVGGTPVNLPKLVSLVQFRPSPVAQETANGQTAFAFGNEANGESKSFIGIDGNNYVNPNLGVASDVLRTTMGAWNSAVVSILPFPILQGSPLDGTDTPPPYNPVITPGTGDTLTLDARSGAGPLAVTASSGNSSATYPNYSSTWPQTTQNILIFNGTESTWAPSGLALFDLNQYAFSTSQNTTASPTYPASEAIAAAENEDPNGKDWLSFLQQPITGSGGNNQLPAKNEFIPIDYDSHRGEITTGFSIQEFGNPAATTKNVDNSPMIPTSGLASDSPGFSSAALTPAADSAAQAAAPTTNFYDPNYASINERYNLAYYKYAGLRPLLKRFIDLRVQPEGDGWASPFDMDPGDPSFLAYIQNYNPASTSQTYADTKTPWATGWTGFDNCTILPGSEVVIGPDQTNSTGSLVRYTRVTANPGPNQYVINYTNLAEPQDYTQLTSSTLPDTPTAAYDPTTKSYPSTAYDPHKVWCTLIEPRYKVGYIEFDSDPNVPLPAGYMHVTYRVQFNRPADAVAVNYDSREVMKVELTMRSYPSGYGSPNPQTITLEASAPVKNFIR